MGSCVIWCDASWGGNIIIKITRQCHVGDTQIHKLNITICHGIEIQVTRKTNILWYLLNYNLLGVIFNITLRSLHIRVLSFPATPLFVQRLDQNNKKENIETPHYRSNGGRCIAPTKGQQCRNRLHIMVSLFYASVLVQLYSFSFQSAAMLESAVLINEIARNCY